MKDPHYDDAVTVDTILKNIGRIKHPQHDLSKIAPSDGVAEQRILLQQICLGQKVAATTLAMAG